MMKTSEAGIELIKAFEGCVLTAYKAHESEEYYTIGYGHYGPDVKKGQTITKEEAVELLKKDLPKYEKRVDEYYDIYGWNQNEFDALVSFCYNIGNIKQLTLAGRRTRPEIASKIPAYCKAGGEVLYGLQLRRQKELELFLTALDEEKMSNREKAYEVLDGKYGNYPERKIMLEAEGYNYRAVQDEVNLLCRMS